MLNNIENVALEYITYTKIPEWRKYHALKVDMDYIGGFRRIFTGQYKINMSFLLGILDSKRHRFLYKNKKYYNNMLMFLAKLRYENKLVVDMVKHGIKETQEWRLRRWMGIDQNYDLKDYDLEDYEITELFD